MKLHRNKTIAVILFLAAIIGSLLLTSFELEKAADNRGLLHSPGSFFTGLSATGEWLWHIAQTHSLATLLLFSITFAGLTLLARNPCLKLLLWLSVMDLAVAATLCFGHGKWLLGAVPLLGAFGVMAWLTRNAIETPSVEPAAERRSWAGAACLPLLFIFIFLLHSCAIDIKPGMVPLKSLPRIAAMLQDGEPLGKPEKWSALDWLTFMQSDHVPLSQLALSGWLRLFGISPLAMIMLNVWFGAITVFPLYRLMRLFLRSQWLALSSTGLYCCSPFVLSFSRYASERGHILSPLHAIATFYLLIQGLLQRRRRQLGSALVLGSLGFYLYEPNYIILPIVIVVLLVESCGSLRRDKKLLAAAFVTATVALAAMWPRISRVMNIGMAAGFQLSVANKFIDGTRLSVNRALVQLPFCGQKIFQNCEDGWFTRPGGIETAPLLAAGLIGLFLASRRIRRPEYRVLLLWLGGGLLPALLGPEVAPRRLLVFIPVFYILVALALDHWRQAIAGTQRLAGTGLAVIFAGMILALGLVNISQYWDRVPLKEVEEPFVKQMIDPLLHAGEGMQTYFYPKLPESEEYVSFFTRKPRDYGNLDSDCSMVGVMDTRYLFFDEVASSKGLVFTTDHDIMIPALRARLREVFPEQAIAATDACLVVRITWEWLHQLHRAAINNGPRPGTTRVSGSFFAPEDSYYDLTMIAPSVVSMSLDEEPALEAAQPQARILLGRGMHAVNIVLIGSGKVAEGDLVGWSSRSRSGELSAATLFDPWMASHEYQRADAVSATEFHHGRWLDAYPENDRARRFAEGVRGLALEAHGDLVLLGEHSHHIFVTMGNLSSRVQTEWVYDEHYNKLPGFDDIAAAGKNIIAVGKERSLIFDRGGRVLGSLAATPRGGRVAAFGEAMIAVLSPDERTVTIFDGGGELLQSFQLRPAEAAIALDLDFDAEGKICVLESDGRVTSYFSDGSVFSSFLAAADVVGSYRSTEPTYASQLTIDRQSDCLYISDPNRKNIFVFKSGRRLIVPDKNLPSPFFVPVHPSAIVCVGSRLLVGGFDAAVSPVSFEAMRAERNLFLSEMAPGWTGFTRDPKYGPIFELDR